MLFLNPSVFTWKTFSKKMSMQMNERKKWFLEKVECLISLSLWRNLLPVVEILSRKLRNDDQASSMWQQQKSKQTAAHATLMPRPIFLAKSQVYSNSLFKSHAFSLLFISFIVSGRTFCVFFCGPAHFSKQKLAPPSPAFFLLIIGYQCFLNSRCDLSKHNQRPWETEYLC